MNSLMRSVGYANHIIGVEQALSVLQYVFLCNRVYVMDNDTRSDRFSISDNPIRNLMLRNAKVTSHVSNDNFVTEHPPFSRLVKVLIQIPVKSKCIMPNSAMQLQIMEPVFKGRILAEFRICSLIHRCLPPRRIRASP